MLFAAAAAYLTLAYPPTTDEPHYLALTESLVADGDVRLAREYGSGALRKFYPTAAIDPDGVITQDGEMFSQHT